MLRIKAQQEEKELFEMINTWPMKDVINVLTGLIQDLPEDEKKFYEAEIDTWGKFGKKSVLINDIIALIPAGDVLSLLDVLMHDSDENMPALTSLDKVLAAI
jgi:hypothetical protein